MSVSATPGWEGVGSGVRRGGEDEEGEGVREGEPEGVGEGEGED